MRDRDQVILPLNLEISISKEDFVFKVAEICEELDYVEGLFDSSKLFTSMGLNWRAVCNIIYSSINKNLQKERK